MELYLLDVDGFFKTPKLDDHYQSILATIVSSPSPNSPIKHSTSPLQLTNPILRNIWPRAIFREWNLGGMKVWSGGGDLECVMTLVDDGEDPGVVRSLISCSHDGVLFLLVMTVYWLVSQLLHFMLVYWHANPGVDGCSESENKEYRRAQDVKISQPCCTHIAVHWQTKTIPCPLDSCSWRRCRQMI